MAELTKSIVRTFLQDLQVLSRRYGIDENTLKQIVALNSLPAPQAPKFVVGDRVAWSHKIAGLHGPSSVLMVDALPTDSAATLATTDPETGESVQGDTSKIHSTPIGTIVGPANEQNTWWTVAFDEEHLGHPGILGASGTHPDQEKLVLTSDELVKVED